VIEEAEGLGGSARLTHPIRCRVSGGYTISKLQGFRGAESPESLLTCILQVLLCNIVTAPGNCAVLRIHVNIRYASHLCCSMPAE
jgi:hypothetical protein